MESLLSQVELREFAENANAARAEAADAKQRCEDAVALMKTKEIELSAALLRIDAYEASLERTSAAFAQERRRHFRTLNESRASQAKTDETVLVSAIIARVTLVGAIRSTTARLAR